MIKKIAASALTIVLILSSMLIFHVSTVYALDTDKTNITLSSTKTQYNVGDTLTVSITATNIADIYGVQFTLTYDPNILQLQSDGVVYNKNIFNNNWVDSPVDEETGTLKYALIASSLNPNYPDSTLGTVTFKALKVGSVKILLNNIKADNNKGIQIQYDIQNQMFLTIHTDGPTPPTTPPGGGPGPTNPGDDQTPVTPPARTSSRIGGTDRIDTAVKIAEEAFSGTVSNCIITTANNYPDALSGSVLAGKLGAPILLVGSTVKESSEALDYVKQHLDNAGAVYILGGTGAVSDIFITELNTMGITNIKRLGGTDRIDTSRMIADTLNVSQGTPVVIATADNFPDALSISSAAAVKGYPILLSSKDSLSQNIKDELKAIKPGKVYIAGGTGVLADSVISDVKAAAGLDGVDIIRLGGSDRYDTSIAIAEYFNLSTDTAFVATGLNFPDALAGSILAAQENAPIILADSTDASRQLQFIGTQKYSKLVILGGEGAVSKNIENQLLK